jgi:hypothetical protein
MTLHDLIAADAVTVFTSTDDFAEVITYYPHRHYGEAARDPRSINAIVFREQIQVLTQDGDTVAPVWQIHVANNVATGISSEELDLGGDQLEFPPRDGKPAETRTVTQLVGQDHGMLILECR